MGVSPRKCGKYLLESKDVTLRKEKASYTETFEASTKLLRVVSQTTMAFISMS